MVSIGLCLYGFPLNYIQEVVLCQNNYLLIRLQNKILNSHRTGHTCILYKQWKSSDAKY